MSNFLQTYSEYFPRPRRPIQDVTNTQPLKSSLKDNQNGSSAKLTKEYIKENKINEVKVEKEPQQENPTGLKEEMLGKMLLQLCCGEPLAQISEEIAKNADGKKALVFCEYLKKLQSIEHEVLGKRSYEDFDDDEEEESFKKLLKTTKEKRKEISKEQREENMLRKSLPFYRHVPFFVQNIQSLSLFQQELAAFKKFAGPTREKIIDKAMEQGLNSIYYIYLFKKKEKTMKEIETAMKKSNKNFDLWGLIIEYIRSFPKTD